MRRLRLVSTSVIPGPVVVGMQATGMKREGRRGKERRKERERERGRGGERGRERERRVTDSFISSRFGRKGH